jgi:hypothetical protein
MGGSKNRKRGMREKKREEKCILLNLPMKKARAVFEETSHEHLRFETVLMFQQINLKY